MNRFKSTKLIAQANPSFSSKWQVEAKRKRYRWKSSKLKSQSSSYPISDLNYSTGIFLRRNQVGGGIYPTVSGHGLSPSTVWRCEHGEFVTLFTWYGVEMRGMENLLQPFMVQTEKSQHLFLLTYAMLFTLLHTKTLVCRCWWILLGALVLPGFPMFSPFYWVSFLWGHVSRLGAFCFFGSLKYGYIEHIWHLHNF